MSDLHPRPDKKRIPPISPEVWTILIVILVFLLAVLIALNGYCNYYYNMSL